MPVATLPDTVFDGDFDFPIAIEGGPLTSVDEVTKAQIITRFFVVKKSKYVPLTQGTVDPTIRDAYLITETPNSASGPLLFFQRVYSTLPPARTEPRTISFSLLGKSSVDRSAVTGAAIGWNQYGEAAPNTRDVNATVEISYAIDPNTFVRPPITKNSYNGNPVDFRGFVYKYVGNVVVSPELTEPRWTLAGSTFFALYPALWIQEVNVSRWRGPIWQMEVVKVFPNETGFF